MTRAIVSLAIGNETLEVAKYTRPLLEKYAKKCDAEYFEINEFHARELQLRTPHYVKLYLGKLLSRFDRIIYIDNDILVKEDAIDLFKIVPEDHLGIFEEGYAFPERKEQFSYFCGQWNTATKKQFDIRQWDKKYYNTGVMVLSKQHRVLFEKPEVEIFNFGEQSYLNMLISKCKLKIHKLDVKYNSMTYVKGYQKGEFVHYSGISNEQRVRLLKAYYTNNKLELPSFDTEKIDKFVDIVTDKTKRTYIVATQVTGLGDKLNLTPALRHYAKKHPGEEITLLIDGFVPEIFKGNPNITYLSNFYHSQPKPTQEDKIIKLNWSYFEQHQHGHVCQSYCHHMLGNYEEDLTMEVFTNDGDNEFVKETYESLPKDKPLILISPTWTMKNRGLSIGFWYNFAERMSSKYHVVSIGSKRDYELKNVIDLRGHFKVNQIPKFLNYVDAVFCVQTGLLHLAGCNPKVPIINFSSGEFPSEMHLPYRNGSIGWNCEVVEHDCPIKQECFDGHIGESIIRPMVEENVRKLGHKHNIMAIRKWTAWNYCAKKNDKHSCSKEIESKVLNELVPRWLDEL